MPVIEIQARWRATPTSNIDQNVHYFVGDTLDAGDIVAAAARVRDAYNFMAANLPTTYVRESYLGRLVSTQGMPYIPTVPGPIVGLEASDRMPNRLCILVQFTRAAPSPNRKRLYLGPFCEANNSGGAPGSGILSNLVSLASHLNDTNSINGKPAAYAIGRYIGSPAYMPVAFQLATFAVSTKWASLRSRSN